MAYAVHFRFQWRSANDNIFRIDILEDGYAGSVIQRPLGGSPQLRRNRNGAICGTSLEFLAQAQVDGEFATLYTSNAFAFRVDLYQNETLIWQGYITPELYSEPYIATPYNVRVVATDNLGELKLSDYAAQGRVTLSALLGTILNGTGLSFPIHWLSTMRPSDPAEVAAEDMAASTTINLDNMAGETQYDVLSKILDTYHAIIVQQDCCWVIVRETDLEALRNDATITAPDGATFGIADFGSMRTNDWWPVGFLSQTVQPAKREKVIAAPNAWADNLLPRLATSTTNATYVEPTDGSMSYYELTPWNSSQVVRTCSVAWASEWSEWSPVKDLTLALSLQTFGVLTGHSYGKKCAAVTVRIIGSDGNNYVQKYISAEGALSTSSVSALDIDGIYRDLPETFYINLPVYSKKTEAGWVKIYQIQVNITTISSEDAISRMQVYEWHCNIAEQNQGYQVTCQLNNNARGADDMTEIAAADNTDKAIESIFVTNGLKYAAGGASIDEWKSDNILSMPLLEFLARDYCLSIAVPRLRMEGRMSVPGGNSLPLLFRGGGLIYWPETWDWNLVDDAADISMISLPAAAIQVTSIIRQAEGSGGFAGGSYSGGGGGGTSYFEEDGTGVKLLDDYTVLKAPSLEAVNNGDIKGTWKGVAVDVTHGGTGLNAVNVAYGIMFSNSSFGFSLLAPNEATTKKFLSQTGNGSSIQSNAPVWSTVGAGDVSVTGDPYGVLIRNSSGTISAIDPNTATTKKFLAQTGNGGSLASNAPAWSTLGLADIGLTADLYSLIYVNNTGKLAAFSPNTATTKKFLTQTGNGASMQSNAPVWSTLSASDLLGAVQIGSASQPIYYTGSALSACTSIDNSYLTGAGKINIMGTDVALGGSVSTFASAGTFNGAITINNTLQVGNATTARSLTVYGTLGTTGAVTIDGATVIYNTLTVGSSDYNRNMQLHGELHFNGQSNVYLNYIAAQAGIHCSTGFYTDGYLNCGLVSSSSDSRLKKNLRDINLTIDQIAAAPAVEFDWVDETRGKGAGSIAQYWQALLPQNVHNFGGEYLSMEYGNMALISSILLARKVKELEQEIQRLKGGAA